MGRVQPRAAADRRRRRTPGASRGRLQLLASEGRMKMWPAREECVNKYQLNSKTPGSFGEDRPGALRNWSAI
jgi:hypothetical protein